MTDKIHVGLPFYFPTQAILVDDDPDFLEGVSLMLDSKLSYQLFQSAHQAKEHVDQAHQHVNFIKRCYSNYKTGPMASDSLSHIDIGKIHNEIFNSARFQTASTVIVDYSMPEMNGLEFLASLKNPFIKKVLLTGQADMELAVKAFNSQLIDQFIDKHDPKLKQILNSTLAAFEDQYFRNSFKLLTDPILANNHDAFLVDSEFQTFFERLREKNNIVEYYMIDEPQEGFLLLDGDGNKTIMLIYTDESLQLHKNLIEKLNPPEELLEALNRGELAPDYDDQLKALSKKSHFLTNWKEHYYPTTTIQSQITYHVALIPAQNFTQLEKKDVFSYNFFQQANFNPNEIFH